MASKTRWLTLLLLVWVTIARVRSQRQRESVWSLLRKQYGSSNGTYIAFSLQVPFLQNREDLLRSKVQQMQSSGKLHYLCRYVTADSCSTSQPGGSPVFLVIVQALDQECCTAVTPKPPVLNGQWGEWGRWSRCSVTCGQGSRTRSRKCDHPPPSAGGQFCLGYNIMYGQCPYVKCPTGGVNGQWGVWGRWSRCSVTCGQGSRTRSRKCDHPPPSAGGRVCPGYGTQYGQCPYVPCTSTVVKGQWGEWGRWSRCSMTCGQGSRTRSRKCDHPPPSPGGQFCPGYGTQYGQCPYVPCTSTAVNGQWGEWGRWSRCSVTCGQGSRTRSRKCDHPLPSVGGHFCTGSGFQNAQCPYVPCTTATPVVKGQWGEWGRWSGCSVTCGQGSRTRSRQCDHPPPSPGGQFCPGYGTQYVQCPYVPCTSTVVNGQWGEWGRWSRCSVTCGQGSRTRSRQCDHPPPSPGGQFCPGSRSGFSQCMLATCPALGRQCSWTQYGAAGRILGGTPAQKGEYPWLVHLVIDGSIRCAGVIVDKLVVLTAGHCLSGRIHNNMLNTSDVEIVAGNYQRSLRLEPNAQRISVIKGQRHYNYDPVYLTNDVTVLLLARPLQFNKVITKVCLPSKTDTLPHSCAVAGWGSLSYTYNFPQELQHVELQVYDYQTCRRVFDSTTPYDISKFLMGGIMCAANGTSGGKDSCRGDSGSGLMCLARDAQGPFYKLYGLVSSGFGCGGKGQPGYYAYLPFYLDWITQTINLLKRS